MKEPKFLNNSYVNETKYGFLLKLSREAIESLEVINGQYYISMNKNKNGEGWHFQEANWAKKDAGKFQKPQGIRGTSSGAPHQEKFGGPANPGFSGPNKDIWGQAKQWQEQQEAPPEPSWGSPEDLPF